MTSRREQTRGARVVGPGARLTSLKAFLEQVPRGETLRVASAYCTMAGALELDAVLAPRRVELLAGIDDFVTDPKLFRLEGSLAGRWIVRPVNAASGPAGDSPRGRRRIFHPKLVWAGDGASSLAYVGSGNLTASGLDRNVELGVMLCGRAVATQLEQVWDELRAHEVRPFRLDTYAERRKQRPALGVISDLVPRGDQVLVLEWNPLGHASTQLQFSPAIAHAFFGAFETDEVTRKVEFVRDARPYQVRLSDHYRSDSEPRTFGLNLGHGLRGVLQPRFKAGFVLVGHLANGRFQVGLTSRASPLGERIEDIAENALVSQRGTRGARAGHLMAAVLRMTPDLRPEHWG